VVAMTSKMSMVLETIARKTATTTTKEMMILMGVNQSRFVVPFTAKKAASVALFLSRLLERLVSSLGPFSLSIKKRGTQKNGPADVNIDCQLRI